MDDVASIRERLTREDDNYRRLNQKHRDFEEKLAALQERRFLSEDERLEEARLKKMKLRIKDEMESVLRQHLEGVGKSG